GRVAYTGVDKNNTKERSVVQAEADASVSQYVNKTTTANLYAGTTIYYNKGSVYPNSFDEIYTINYYDNYTFDSSVSNPGTVYNQTIATNAKGLATASKVRVLGTSFWITTVTYYDQKGRPVYVHSTNEYLNTTDIVETQLDFAGKVLTSKTTHTKDSNAPIVTVDTFTYDHMSRLLDQSQQIGTQATEHIVSNTYDEIGQLTTKNVGGTTPGTGLQTVDYTYNVRGWLTGINDINNIGDDLFTFKINYNNQDFDATSAYVPLYNGNIVETQWRTANDHIKRGYEYAYDNLNRLFTGQYGEGNSLTINNSYTMVAYYDKNGNIDNLHRFGSNSVYVDNLNYEYDNGNKLLSVTDSRPSADGFNDANKTGDDYVYDANGNMTIDKNKGITAITYNHLNLPEQVTITNGTTNGNITYIYDATGVKISKKVTEYPNQTTTQYAGNYIYKSNLSLGLPPGPNNSDEKVLQFLNHPEGYIEPDGNNYKYIYQYKDHLGNIRLSYADNDNDGKID
ncbi:hypothetical protein U0D62_25515, partial [Aquimarina sp. 2201CG5-10]|nr:hypothetical protein [Aquimarina sp. 2201CG5-10]